MRIVEVPVDGVRGELREPHVRDELFFLTEPFGVGFVELVPQHGGAGEEVVLPRPDRTRPDHDGPEASACVDEGGAFTDRVLGSDLPGSDLTGQFP